MVSYEHHIARDVSILLAELLEQFNGKAKSKMLA